jgi:hypothetical protein
MNPDDFNAVKDKDASLFGGEGISVTDNSVRTRKWDNVTPALVETAMNVLRDYTSEKNGRVQRLYVTDLKIGKTTLKGLWRCGKVYDRRQEDGSITIFQELHKGYITSFSWSEFRIVGGTYGQNSFRAPILRLRNVAESAVHTICTAINASEQYTNISCYNGTLTGTWKINRAEPDLDGDGGYGITVYFFSNVLSGTSFSENALSKTWSITYQDTDAIDPQTWMGSDDNTYFTPTGSTGSYKVPVGYVLNINNNPKANGLYDTSVQVREAKQFILNSNYNGASNSAPTPGVAIDGGNAENTHLFLKQKYASDYITANRIDSYAVMAVYNVAKADVDRVMGELYNAPFYFSTTVNSVTTNINEFGLYDLSVWIRFD